MIELTEELNQSKNTNKNTNSNQKDSELENSQNEIYQSQNTTSQLNSKIQQNIDIGVYKSPSKWTHLKLLLWKNLMIYKNNYKSLLFMIIAPIILNFLATGFQYLTDQKVGGKPIIETQLMDIPKIPKCNTIRGKPEDCISVAIGIVGPKEDWMDLAIETIKQENDLNDYDVQIVNEIKYPSIPYVTHYGFTDYLGQNPGKVQVGVEFCSSNMLLIDKSKASPFQFFDIGQEIPSIYSTSCKDLVISRPDLQFPGYSENVYFPDSRFYTIAQNITSLNFRAVDFNNSPVELDQISIKLKLDIDQSLMKYEQEKLGQKSPKIDVQIKNFPQTIRRETNGYNLINAFGSFIFFLTPMFMFLSLLGEIVREKEYRLRQGMNIFGINHSVFWLSWFITGLVFAIFLAVYTVFLGHLFQFPIFLGCPAWIFCLLFFSFNFSLLFIAFFISTLVPTQKIANTVSYAFVLMCIVVELFFSSQSFISFFYVTEGPSWLPYFRFFLELYPPFSYSKIYSDIGYKSGFHFEIADRKWVEGPGYTYEQYSQNISGRLVRGKVFERSSSQNTMLVLYLNSLIFFLLTVYFDNIIQSNRGHNNNWYFMLTKKYWCKKKYQKQTQHQNALTQKILLKQSLNNNNKNKYNSNKNQQIHYDKSVNDEKVQIQKQQSQEFNDIKGVRIGNLSKTYTSGIFQVRKKQALQNLYLHIQNGELCTILGHNGSGKTTLINILTGMLDLDEGEVIINGYNLGLDLEQIRQQIGLCPQFDILWEDLTASQHISLYCQIKGINDKNLIEKIIDSKLAQVSLSHVKHAVTSTYSGGMKRRLSIALASIGNPSIIFLDEPTTGMDPKSRREVWQLIQELKKDKSIILTTHSMEEADILSDRIVVMVDGTLKCIGKSIDLKNQYGGGYRIELVVATQHSNLVTQAIGKLFDDFKLVDTAGGSLVFTAPINDSKNMILLFQLIENKKEINQEFLDKVQKLNLGNLKDQDCKQIIQTFVKDWGVSHATLEEVFMNITQKKESKIHINKQ